jgi:hypothetical protein
MFVVPRVAQAAVQARVKQIRTLLEGTELDYEREKLNERIARLAGGVAIIQVCARPARSLCCEAVSSGWAGTLAPDCAGIRQRRAPCQARGSRICLQVC